jgi:anti-anti-sigma factor
MPTNDLDQLAISQSETPEGYRIIQLKGWITAKNVPNVKNAIQLGRGLTTILDMTDVPYVDSSGLGALLSGYVDSQKYGGKFVLAGVVPRVRELLQLTKIEPLFRIYRSSADAAKELSKSSSA